MVHKSTRQHRALGANHPHRSEPGIEDSREMTHDEAPAGMTTESHAEYARSRYQTTAAEHEYQAIIASAKTL